MSIAEASFDSAFIDDEELLAPLTQLQLDRHQARLQAEEESAARRYPSAKSQPQRRQNIPPPRDHAAAARDEGDYEKTSWKRKLQQIEHTHRDDDNDDHDDAASDEREFHVSHANPPPYHDENGYAAAEDDFDRHSYVDESIASEAAHMRHDVASDDEEFVVEEEVEVLEQAPKHSPSINSPSLSSHPIQNRQQTHYPPARGPSSLSMHSAPSKLKEPKFFFRGGVGENLVKEIISNAKNASSASSTASPPTRSPHVSPTNRARSMMSNVSQQPPQQQQVSAPSQSPPSASPNSEEWKSRPTVLWGGQGGRKPSAIASRKPSVNSYALAAEFAANGSSSATTNNAASTSSRAAPASPTRPARSMSQASMRSAPPLQSAAGTNNGGTNHKVAAAVAAAPSEEDRLKFLGIQQASKRVASAPFIHKAPSLKKTRSSSNASANNMAAPVSESGAAAVPPASVNTFQPAPFAPHKVTRITTVPSLSSTLSTIPSLASNRSTSSIATTSTAAYTPFVSSQVAATEKHPAPAATAAAQPKKLVKFASTPSVTTVAATTSATYQAPTAATSVATASSTAANAAQNSYAAAADKAKRPSSIKKKKKIPVISALAMTEFNLPSDPSQQSSASPSLAPSPAPASVSEIPVHPHHQRGNHAVIPPPMLRSPKSSPQLSPMSQTPDLPPQHSPPPFPIYQQYNAHVAPHFQQQLHHPHTGPNGVPQLHQMPPPGPHGGPLPHFAQHVPPHIPHGPPIPSHAPAAAGPGSNLPPHPHAMYPGHPGAYPPPAFFNHQGHPHQHAGASMHPFHHPLMMQHHHHQQQQFYPPNPMQQQQPLPIGKESRSVTFAPDTHPPQPMASAEPSFVVQPRGGARSMSRQNSGTGGFNPLMQSVATLQEQNLLASLDRLDQKLQAVQTSNPVATSNKAAASSKSAAALPIKRLPPQTRK